ncbi:MAG: hypothetical protein ACFFDN_03240, partial [Candidatus Hodarchaeota archaeon]
MPKNILMIAYTNYSFDARVTKEAEACVKNGYFVDFIALRERDDNRNETINGVNIFRINQLKYRGKSFVQYFMSYLKFFIKCLIKVTILYIKKNIV